MECWQLQNVAFTYPGQDRPALDGVNLSVESGEFITLLGPSGCGKTTLLRLLKPALAPHGTRQGTILFRGSPLDSLDPETQVKEIGFVLQSPENQIVTHKVWHELSFGLESLGLPQGAIRSRVAEMAAFFGIEDWFHRDTSALSGGQKQLLSLAAVMSMGPQVLLLDEPTSQLDPIAAQTFLDCLARINRELGTTILLSEHRLEQALPLSTRCLLLEEGRPIFYGPPKQLAGHLIERHHPMLQALPTPLRVWAACGDKGPAPLTPGEGRQWLARYATSHPLIPPPPPPPFPDTPPALSAEEVWFRYQQGGTDVLRGLSLVIPQGSLFAILGGNGAGKSTLLSLLSGALRPQRGHISLLGKTLEDNPEAAHFSSCLAVLPQEPKTLFSEQTVAADLALLSHDQTELDRVYRLCRLEGLLWRHPYDLSGGELQRAALAKVLLTRPQVLLLDEPTKGMDAPFKAEFAALLATLRAENMTVVMVSHDGEFCACHATHCALLFDGTITTQGDPQTFFAQNLFYTTAASRMARDLLPQVVTAQALIDACGGTEPPLSVSPPPSGQPFSPFSAPCKPPRPSAGSKWAGGALVGLCLLAGLLAWQGLPLLSALAGGQWLPSLLWLVLAGLGLRLLGLGRPRHRLASPPSLRLTFPTLAITALFLLILIPATLLAGVYLLGDRKYYFISLLVLLEALAPAFLALESSRPSPRLLVLLAALAALGAAGRAAFFMLPQFKPVAAVAVVAGVAFGGRAGFLVGALSMLLSNFFYVQGAWTPWQMVAMGLIGLLAGVLGRWVGQGRLSLALYGFFAVLMLYGGLINPASVLLYQPHPTFAMLAAAWALGFPMDLVHATATAFFLWVGGPALLEQLDRLRVKYGLTT